MFCKLLWREVADDIWNLLDMVSFIGMSVALQNVGMFFFNCLRINYDYIVKKKGLRNGKSNAAYRNRSYSLSFLPLAGWPTNRDCVHTTEKR